MATNIAILGVILVLNIQDVSCQRRQNVILQTSTKPTSSPPPFRRGTTIITATKLTAATSPITKTTTTTTTAATTEPTTPLAFPWQCLNGRCVECSGAQICRNEFFKYESLEECELFGRCGVQDEDIICPESGWFGDGQSISKCYRSVNIVTASTYRMSSNNCADRVYDSGVPIFTDDTSFEAFINSKSFATSKATFYIGLMLEDGEYFWLRYDYERVPFSYDQLLPYALQKASASNETVCHIVDPTAQEIKPVQCNQKQSRVMCQKAVDYCSVVIGRNAFVTTSLTEKPVTCLTSASCAKKSIEDEPEDCVPYEATGMHFCCPRTEKTKNIKGRLIFKG